MNETIILSYMTLMETKSFTETAKKLYITQQAVSKHLAKLEDELNTTLILRGKGEFSVTETGKIYYEAFCSMHETLQNAHRLAEEASKRERQSLVIGQTELLSMNDADKEILKFYKQSNSQVSITYRMSDNSHLIDLVRTKDIDLAILLTPIELPSDLAFYPIETIKEMLVVSTKHPKASQATGFESFLDESILFSASSEGNSEVFRNRVELLGFDPSKMKETDNFLSSCTACDNNQGVMFLMERCNALMAGNFNTYPTGHSLTLSLAYRKDNKKRALLDLIEIFKRGRIDTSNI